MISEGRIRRDPRNGVYEDRSIVSCINTNGAVICEAEDSTDQDSFKVIATDENLFYYPAYDYCDSIYGESIFDMTQYGKSLYVSICTGKPENAIDEDTMQPFGIVRGDVRRGEIYIRHRPGAHEERRRQSDHI